MSELPADWNFFSTELHMNCGEYFKVNFIENREKVHITALANQYSGNELSLRKL